MCEMMLEGSKEALTVLIVTILLVSKGSKMVFVVFMQHCLQSGVSHLTHVERVKSVLCIQGLSPFQGGSLILSCGFISSPPVTPRRQLCQLSWTCQTTRVIAGKMHSQLLILNLRGCSVTWYFLHIYGNKAASSIP